jgi:hypothetical protein
VDRLHTGEIVGEQGRDHPRQEHASAGMEQSQQPSDGNAAPRPLPRRWAERFLQSWGIGHRAARAIDAERTMTMPPPVIQSEVLHRTAETLQEAVKEA